MSSPEANGPPQGVWYGTEDALVLDLVVWPQPEFDLRVPRVLLALAAVLSLIWGFVWQVEEE